MANCYPLQDILTIARIHPFYSTEHKYPPNSREIAQALKPELSTEKLLHKTQLYETIERLYADTCCENGYRTNSYVSTTGGGSGKSLPMLFLTNTVENRNQRVAAGRLMQTCKVMEPTDWVFNMHHSGSFYRALDLTTEIIEHAGGTVLSAGHTITHEKAVDACQKFHINVLSGDASQIISLAHHVATLSESLRSSINITKIIYTCEMLSRTRRKFLTSIFGPVAFYSIFASAETGPWAIANFNLTGEPADDNAADFIYDERAMRVEVLAMSSPAADSQQLSLSGELEFAPEATAGHLVLTCLQRLQNPLVRYVSGDIGSVHELPASAMRQIGEDKAAHLKVLRLYGRDQRFSFKWLGEYYDFAELSKVMQTEGWDILHWQVILKDDDLKGPDICELRLFRDWVDGRTVACKELERDLAEVFHLTPLNAKQLKVVNVKNMEEFVKSETSNKIIRFLDFRA